MDDREFERLKMVVQTAVDQFIASLKQAGIKEETLGVTLCTEGVALVRHFAGDAEAARLLKGFLETVEASGADENGSPH